MKHMKSFILGKASEARSEERSVRHRKSVLLGGLIFFLFFGIFGFSQTAEAETITTESGEWKWEYWTSPPSKQTKVSYSQAASSTSSSASLLVEKSNITAATRRASMARNNNFLFVLHFIITTSLVYVYMLSQNELIV